MQSSTLFTIEAGPFVAGECLVVGFRGREAASRPYCWDVTVDVEDIDAEAIEHTLLLQPAALTVPFGETSARVIHGVVAAVRHVGATSDGGRLRLSLRVVPRVWLLSRNRSSRVFQDLTAVEVVGTLLRERDVPFEVRLQQHCPRRAYCVQYNESDLAFVARLLAEEGIFYFFEQPGDVERERGPEVGAVEVLVLADHPAACPTIRRREGSLEAVVGVEGALRAPALHWYRGEGGVPAENDVSSLSRERTVRPQASLIRDYDFRSPAVDLTAAQAVGPVADATREAGVARSFPEVMRRAFVARTRGSTDSVLPPLAVDPTRMAMYEHHGEDEEPEISRPEAQLRLAQHRRRAVTVAGAGWCRRLSPGHRFRVEGHPDGTLNAEYTLAEVRHVGRTSDQLTTRAAGVVRAAYESRFVAVPVGVPLVPARPPRVHRQVLETARVVGPPGEEIHTDTYGRIKVQFHWDLVGRGDGGSSCWLRVAQAWAGTNWGAQFIPRVGMEVLVSFLGGDQDRPVVLGCLYNGENTPTFAVPGDKTRSGIRTQSSPGGDGFNELSFEDAKGAEQVYLHAERDLDERVLHDRSTHIGHDDATTIERHQSLSVLGNRAVQVVGDQTTHVEHERRETTDGGVTVTTRGPEHRWNLERVEHRVEGRARYVHTAAVDEEFEDERTVRAKGCVTTLVGAVDEERHWGLHVEGTSEHYASKGHEVTSPEGIILRSGASSIAIAPAGVDIVADVITIRSGNTVITVDAKNVSARAEEMITVEGQKKARLLAPDVSLTKAEALEEAEQPKPPTRILLTDKNGRPLPGRRYRVKQDDGAVRAGFLDADGAAVLPGEQGGTVDFPEFDEVQA